MNTRSSLLAILALGGLLAPASRAGGEELQTLRTPVRVDATIDSLSGDVANGGGEFLLVGRDEASGRERRVLLRFAVHEAIPTGAVVASASLSFRLIQGGADIQLWRITESWRSGRSNPAGDELVPAPAQPGDATWAYRHHGTAAPWSAPGGSLAPQASASFLVSGSEVYYTVGASREDVQFWIDHPAENHGWCLRVAGSQTQLARLESMESSGTYEPHLWVQYYLPGTLPQTYCMSTVNSSGQRAEIGWSGSTSWAANDLRLTVAGAPPNVMGAFFCGPNPSLIPFGNGYRCVDSSIYTPLLRLGNAPASSSGTVDHLLDFSRAPAAVIHPSSMWRFQYWFRDPGAPPDGFNLSDGLFVVVQP
ncbi:MAG: DNRLRE domain-containing protein [Planctomycetes bacterium]|nr:DNRLRE domain-containing protein [Planctomycetota bacterium]